MKVAMVGVGSISGIYLQNITQVFKELELIGVCDLVRERAEKAAAEYHIPKIYDNVEQVVADPEVDIVLNLTRPYEHFEVTKAALMAGKHVYSEKPLGATLEEGLELVALAKQKGLQIGGAPDTFMGAGIQTCRKLIEDGYIGTPVGASAYMVCRGHESWHPDPAFYYQFGGGPMLDMGPYYLTAMVNLLGGVKTVTGMTKTSFPTRTITSQPHYGQVVQVEVPTYVTGIMAFESGVIGTIFTTFDVYTAQVPRIEIYGSEGTLSVPDPNGFGGEVKLFRAGSNQFKEIPLLFDYADNSRGMGLADMAKAIATGREFRADSNQTLHVLEVMTAFQKSSETKQHIDIQSVYHRKPPMQTGLMKGIFEGKQ